mgnify:CR=1 FL=1
MGLVGVLRFALGEVAIEDALGEVGSCGQQGALAADVVRQLKAGLGVLRQAASRAQVDAETLERNLAELEAIASTKDSDEVTAFRAQGPDALKLAREVAREHETLIQSGAPLPPLARFIASHPKMTPFAGAARRSN